MTLEIKKKKKILSIFVQVNPTIAPRIEGLAVGGGQDNNN